MRHVTLARIFGLLLMIATVASAYWLLTADTFKVGQAQLVGDLKYIDAGHILDAAGVPVGEHPSVFMLRSSDMERAMLVFPSIASAQATTSLPNDVVISVVERRAAFGIQDVNATHMVDADGLVIATLDPAAASGLGVPIVDDQRVTKDEVLEGQQIDPIELAAILQLGAVTPALIDSGAASLQLSLTTDDGFVMTAAPQGWQAIFGNYTPNLRPTDIIPRQVQCLRSLIGADEADVTKVYLAPLDQNCGTYLPDATPYAPTPAPSKSR